MRIEVQEMKLKAEGWNVLMQHEMKMLVAQDIKQVKAIITKVRELT
jgi:hypothetical protein